MPSLGCGPSLGCVEALRMGWCRLWLRLIQVTWDANWVRGYGCGSSQSPNPLGCNFHCSLCQVETSGVVMASTLTCHLPGWILIQSMSGGSLGQSQRWSWFPFSDNFGNLVSKPKVLELVRDLFLKCFLFERFFSLVTWLIFGMITNEFFQRFMGCISKPVWGL